ncbi:GGDEF domain-containing protein [Rheinheimera sp.]|uniref:GGDEF domain-containing protein n=1 Tax=Rheinheimera sp. TaxID=1869214 RepID=UPI002FDEF6E0
MLIIKNLRKFTVLSLVVSALVTLLIQPATAASETAFSADELKQQPAFPAEYQKLSYPQRLDWLEQQLKTADSAARIYQLSSEMGFEHFSNYANDKLQLVCQQTKPAKFDLQYRYICAASDNNSYDDSIRQLMQLYDDAIAAKNMDLATQILSGVAWKQSSQGDIASAFRSYELALSLAKQASPEALNDVMLNTAALYVMHGDEAYVRKGVQLQQETIGRLENLKQQQPAATAYADEILALTHHNIGVAYALHLHDYQQALDWFDRVPPDNKELRRSSLVFSALAAAELQQSERAQQLLSASVQAARSTEVNTDYLDCYQQLVQLKLSRQAALQPCQQLGEQTPLEVSLDLYKRMAKLDTADWRLVGLEKLHQLFSSKLEAQLKQSATQSASHAELSRLQLESELKTQLLEKEQSLKKAEQEQHQSQMMLTAAAIAILLLVLLVITIQLRQNRKLAKQYESLSVLDGLTGLHNRRYFEQNIQRELNYVRRSQQDDTGHTIAFYLLDIDHFKKINDNYGHDAGDEVLVEFARRIKQAIRETDMLIRWGGEEFLLVARLEQKTDHHHIAERIRTVVNSQPFALTNQNPLTVSCTIGAVVYPQAKNDVVQMDWHHLVQLADAALYLGKHKERNCWVCVDNILDLAALEQILQQDLALSVSKQQLVLSSSLQSVAPTQPPGTMHN